MATITLFSPYRICPIGAHIDHQGGSVLGRTINLGTTLTYESLSSREIQIISAQFGETKFSIGELDKTHWARYAQAAARVLNLHRGIKAQVRGSLIGSGLSSSASVGLSFLQAMADANEMQFSGEQLVNWDYQLEHDELGLQNGLLDPMSIVHGRKDALLYIDTMAGSVTPVVDPLGNNLAWIIAYSGVSRELTKSGFNVRVAECCEAAAILKSGAQKLGDLPHDIW
jgi:galactokinase